jgi:hypothetical protein
MGLRGVPVFFISRVTWNPKVSSLYSVFKAKVVFHENSN